MISRRHTALPLLATLLGACAAAPPVPPTQYHQLPLPMVADEHAAVLAGRINVLPFQADDIRQDRAILYSPAAPHLTLQQSHYHYWVDPPPRLLQQHLADWLRAHQLAGQVTTEDHTPPGVDLWLRGRIVRMEQELDARESRVHVAIDLQAGRPGEEAPRIQRRLEVVQAVPAQASVEQVVQAFADAFDRVWNDVARALRSAIDGGELLP